MLNEREVFLNASDLPPAEQKSYLDEACKDHPALRAKVEKLLLANARAAEFLETPPVGLTLTIRSDGEENIESIPLDFLTPSDKPGCLGTLAEYEVVGVVGRGAFGIVLRAFDTKLNRVVAIKVMAPELATNPASVKRFLREAQAAAAVRHDHLVTIHAIDERCRPPFIVMEYIQGESLKEKIDRDGALALAEILRIGKQVAAGLRAAHQQGLVHRDIKPANILLEDGIERVKITDFGLARAVDDVGMTKTGIIAGTPQYMSPEQGEGKPVDTRSDLFSLGAVLYAMCTGEAAFQADSAVATLRSVCDEDPKSIREVNPEIPGWLDTFVMQLLAKNADERIQQAHEVETTLGSCLSSIQSDGTEPLPPSVLHAKAPRPHVHHPWRPLLGFLIWIQLFGTSIAGLMEWFEPNSTGVTFAILMFGLGLPIAVIGAKAKAGWTAIGYGLLWPVFIPLLASLVAALAPDVDGPGALVAISVAILCLNFSWGIYALSQIVPFWRPDPRSFWWPPERRYWMLHATQCIVLSGGLVLALVAPDSIYTVIVAALFIGVPLSIYASWMQRGGLVSFFANMGPCLAFLSFVALQSSTHQSSPLEHHALEPEAVPIVRMLIGLVGLAVVFGLGGILRQLQNRDKNEARFGWKSGLLVVGVLVVALTVALPFLDFSAEAYAAGSLFMSTLLCLTWFYTWYQRQIQQPTRKPIIPAIAGVLFVVAISWGAHAWERATRSSYVYFPSGVRGQIEITPIGEPQRRPFVLDVGRRRGHQVPCGEFTVKVRDRPNLKTSLQKYDPPPRVLTEISFVKSD